MFGPASANVAVLDLIRPPVPEITPSNAVAAVVFTVSVLLPSTTDAPAVPELKYQALDRLFSV